MKKVNDIMQSNSLLNGTPPVFTPHELARIEQLADTDRYWIRADCFARRYNRGAEPWEYMSRKQREWIWKIKDDIGNVVKQDRQSKDTAR